MIPENMTRLSNQRNIRNAFKNWVFNGTARKDIEAAAEVKLLNQFIRTLEADIKSTKAEMGEDARELKEDRRELREDRRERNEIR